MYIYTYYWETHILFMCRSLFCYRFEPYFERKKKLMPRPSDLSFFNWETHTSTSNATPNFQVIADNEAGLLFKNKRDRKVTNILAKTTAYCFGVNPNCDRKDASSIVTAGATAKNTERVRRGTVARLGNRGPCVHIHTDNL